MFLYAQKYGKVLKSLLAWEAAQGVTTMLHLFCLHNIPGRNRKTIIIFILYLWDLFSCRSCLAVLVAEISDMSRCKCYISEHIVSEVFHLFPKNTLVWQTREIISQTSPTSDCKYKVMQKKNSLQELEVCNQNWIYIGKLIKIPASQGGTWGTCLITTTLM